MLVGSEISHKIHFVVNLCGFRPAESQTTLHKGYGDRSVLLFSKLYAELQSVEQFGRYFIFVSFPCVLRLRRLFFFLILENSVFDIIVEISVVLALTKSTTF